MTESIPATTWSIVQDCVGTDTLLGQLTCYHMVISTVQVLVYLWQAPLNVPQGDHSKTGGGACLAMVLHNKLQL